MTRPCHRSLMPIFLMALVNIIGLYFLMPSSNRLTISRVLIRRDHAMNGKDD